ncbi:ABC transporter [Amycolatopsis mediterranei S699]|uniref:Transport permease protein n=2 Tax=Amycolatopsis mediterranei TaxID=33910 RepID=A0A0H3DID1_AMYMU|nr:ABC transporter permease [Amycolatopsis mediterranei]ADJ49952.1 ABC-2 type transporter [Amycolatopsis mediterranei U32]AEK46945.1 ABC transporter [Amycolatopsis mediterranei S699]AFO81660.1 ABC transporter [Amycolatopsis mediterranei S699]AGT88789.1 ABC transporter [Amycolatopsis mediterranei RB]KDO07800.1 multidrug ABC transporter permease [Amycolatopsis mediterranei]
MLRDTWLIFRRDMRAALRNPTWVLIGIMQPLLYLFLFGPLMVRTVQDQGRSELDGWMLLTPALIAQLALFGSSFVGFGLLAEFRSGVVERFRVTPVSRVALLLGKVLANALQTVVQAVLIIVLATLAFPLDAPVGGVLLSLVIVFLLAVSLASCSYALALTLKSEETFPALLNAVLIPLLLLSGILLPITAGRAPDWLYTVSRINPFRHVVDVERNSFGGDLTMDALFTGSVVVLVMAVLSLWWGTRTFQKENA